MTNARDRECDDYVVCLERGNYRVDLQVGRVYRMAAPEENDPRDMFRIVDDSGEDYLYPAAWFVRVELPERAKRALAAAGG